MTCACTHNFLLWITKVLLHFTLKTMNTMVIHSGSHPNPNPTTTVTSRHPATPHMHKKEKERERKN